MQRSSWSMLSLILISLVGQAVQAELQKPESQKPESQKPEEVLVTSHREIHTIEVANSNALVADSASLLRKAPGANVNGNGPLTGIQQYRGMYGARVKVTIDGSNISAGGPNWMDPPLSYAPTAQLESLQVYRGIAPVSAGQETIGGLIDAKTWQGDFGHDDSWQVSGMLRLGGQSVNSATTSSGTAVLASQHHRLKVSALHEQGDDAEFADGVIIPSEYLRDRYDLGYGYRRGAHQLQINVAKNDTGEAGTPALPMDIDYIDSDLASVRYRIEMSNTFVEAQAYQSDIEHGMTNYHLRQPPMAKSMWRRNIAEGENRGGALKLVQQDHSGQWVTGFDLHHELHNSDIDNPNNAMFQVINFNDAEQTITGLFVERNQSLATHWQTELGLRYNEVVMDADTVDGTPARMMPAGATLRDRFNNAEREQTDYNIDWVTKLYYQSDASLRYYLGLARKSRSPSYQERYLWLPLEATAGLADGNTYTGNINLDPEVAHELELGIDFKGERLSLSPRLFHRDVHDYIQGTVSTNNTAVMFVNMMNMMNGTSNAAPLEFNNVAATFTGMDMNWSYQLDSQWSLDGVINYVRGERDDIDDYLYRVAPLNALTALNYTHNSWGARLESVLYARQDKVSETNREQATAGYGLVNVEGFWQFHQQMRLGLGVQNLGDKVYADHLAGYNRVSGNEDIAQGARLPGYGRNLFVSLDLSW